VLTDVSAIEKLLADRASMEVGAFVQMVAGATARSGRTRLALRGVRDDLVAQCKQKLAPPWPWARIAALDREMTGSRGRAQDAALKKIWKGHQSMVVFKAESRATPGQSAA
jgi:hypothetical protein